MTTSEVQALVDTELVRIGDPGIVARIRRYLVSPYPVERYWDYGAKGERYTCWTVFEHLASNSVIAYCDKGFGPKYPWGLLSHSGEYMTMGPDFGWYPSLKDAFLDSRATEGPAA